MGDAHVLGDFGIKLADTLTIHDTRLRFSGVDTRTLEQLIPGFRSPRRGVFAGRATVAGGRHALTLDTDLTFDDTRAGTSRVIAVGDIAFPGRGVRATNLRVQMLPLQVAMSRTWYPNLPIGGIVLGNATINGNTSSELRIRADIEHHDRGARSVLDGDATLRLASSGRVEWFDLNVMTRRGVSSAAVTRVDVRRRRVTAPASGARLVLVRDRVLARGSVDIELEPDDAVLLAPTDQALTLYATDATVYVVDLTDATA